MSISSPLSREQVAQHKSSPRLVINNLTVGYDQQLIIKDINLTIPNQAITALIGPNGCGKSTLLKTIARVLTPAQGQILLDQENVHQSSSKVIAKKMALLPQGPIAPEGLTVKELVSLGRYPHQSLIRQWSKEDEAIVEQAMADANISSFADKPITAMSGGQRQRAWIAMILAQQTDILLLDEPTTFLDMKVQVDVLSLLTKITREKGRTLIIVIHELNMAAAYADHLVMMKEGQIVTSGAVEEVFTAENLKEVFALDSHVIKDPYSGCPVCIPCLSHLPSTKGGASEY